MVETSVKFIKPRVLAAIRRVGSYQDVAPGAWQDMLAWLDSFSSEDMPPEGFGFNYDDPRAQKGSQLRYAAAIEAPNSWEPNGNSPAEVLLFEGGVYAIKNYVGPYSDLGPSISKLRDEWLPNKGLVLDRDRAVLTRYKSDPRKVREEERKAEICLPVFAERRSQDRPLDLNAA